MSMNYERYKEYKIKQEEDQLLSKIDRGLDLSKAEIEHVLALYFKAEETIIDGTDQIREMETVVQIGKRFFKIWWTEGYAYDVDNTYWAQRPIEVMPVEQINITKVWVPKDED